MTPVASSETQGAWYQDWRLVAFDGTTFTVPDTEENDEEFGRPGSGRGDGKGAYPQAQAACLVELGTHAVFDARLEPYSVSETKLVEEMFTAVRPGMLVLADRGIYSFQRWTRAAATGADLLWRVPANLILRPVNLLADGSYIAEITPPKNSGVTSFQLRVIEYRLPDVADGKDDLYRLVTTIDDPTQAPAKELAILYHERWDIEGFFKQIKSVQLNADKIFRSKSPDGVRQEFWAHLGVHVHHDAYRGGRRPSSEPRPRSDLPQKYRPHHPDQDMDTGYFPPSPAMSPTTGACWMRSPPKSISSAGTAPTPG